MASMMKYFDAHTHVNFAAFDGDRAEAIARAKEAGISMNVVGTQRDTSQTAVELAKEHDNVWATVGLHPIHTTRSYHDKNELGGNGKGFTSRGEVFDHATYKQLAALARVIAIGECGLDYYRVDESTRDIQIKAFVEQIELANEIGKPLMLHIRNAYDDALALVKAHAKVKGNVHFFAGSWEVAKKFINLGYSLSFTGVITFTHDYDDVIRNMPLDMILSETDAPYVAPVPCRGMRNEPAHVVHVVRRIAEIRGEPLEKVRAQVVDNAERVFFGK